MKQYLFAIALVILPLSAQSQTLADYFQAFAKALQDNKLSPTEEKQLLAVQKLYFMQANYDHSIPSYQSSEDSYFDYKKGIERLLIDLQSDSSLLFYGKAGQKAFVDFLNHIQQQPNQLPQEKVYANEDYAFVMNFYQPELDKVAIQMDVVLKNIYSKTEMARYSAIYQFSVENDHYKLTGIGSHTNMVFYLPSM